MHFCLNGTNSMSCVTPARAQICRGKSHARTPADGVLPGEVMKVQFPMPMRLDWEKILHEGTTDCGGAARPMPAARAKQCTSHCPHGFSHVDSIHQQYCQQWRAARDAANPSDRILTCGSDFTLCEMYRIIRLAASQNLLILFLASPLGSAVLTACSAEQRAQRG